MDVQRILCQQLACYVGLCLMAVRSPHNVRVSVGEGVFRWIHIHLMDAWLFAIFIIQ